jgi:SAM-dependent methyltransferase
MNGEDRRGAIGALLACPRCRRPIRPDRGRLACACGAAFRVVHDVPVFVGAQDGYTDLRHVTQSTNPYSPKNLRLFREHPDALILDFGAGNPAPEELFDNVVRMDFAHYRSCDVVSTERNLPFRDGSFDFVVTESVFEHVRDPWHYAAELHRVLKPGGRIHVDCAFLFPVHGEPHNYYNMTPFGIEETFKMFRKIESGVEPYQSAGTAMNVMRNTFLSLVDDEPAREELKVLLGTRDFADFDRFIPREKRGLMSAGVYFLGEKA